MYFTQHWPKIIKIAQFCSSINDMSGQHCHGHNVHNDHILWFPGITLEKYSESKFLVLFLCYIVINTHTLF